MLQVELGQLAPVGRFGPAAQREIATRLAPLLLGLMLAAMIIGERPFAVDAADKAAGAASGSMFNRLVVFGLFAAALPIAMVRLGAVLGLLARNWLGAAIVGWSLLSFLWASHPDLTIRRGLAFAITWLTLAILVAATRSAGTVLRTLGAVFAVITLLNIFVMVAMPAVSWSPIGENGIFDAKNTAGTMAMLSVVVLGTLLVMMRGVPARAAVLAVLAMSWYFLIVSRSKTSLGVTVVMSAAGPALYMLLRCRPAVRLGALLAVSMVSVGAAVVAGGAGVTDADLRMAMFGDLTFSLRTPIWEAVLRSIAERPWLGHGFGSFWDVGAKLNPLRSAAWNEFFMEAQIINTAHNGYLDQLLQTGIVGFALGLAAIARCVQLLYGGAASSADRGEQAALVGLLCVAVCLILNNFLESYLFRTGDVLGYLFMMLMLLAERERARQRAQA